jgi:hypothetical protein
MGGDFESRLAASVSVAKGTLDEREKAANDAAAAQRQREQIEAERLAAVRGRATRFKHKHLEPLQRVLLQQFGKAGFAVVGNYVDEHRPNGGTVAITVDTGGDWVIKAAIMYRTDDALACVDARTSAGPCYEAHQAFDDATALPWFESHLAEAARKLIETGNLPRVNIVTYNGRQH